MADRPPCANCGNPSQSYKTAICHACYERIRRQKKSPILRLRSCREDGCEEMVTGNTLYCPFHGVERQRKAKQEYQGRKSRRLKECRLEWCSATFTAERGHVFCLDHRTNASRKPPVLQAILPSCRRCGSPCANSWERLCVTHRKARKATFNNMRKDLSDVIEELAQEYPSVAFTNEQMADALVIRYADGEIGLSSIAEAIIRDVVRYGNPATTGRVGPKRELTPAEIRHTFSALTNPTLWTDDEVTTLATELRRVHDNNLADELMIWCFGSTNVQEVA